MNFGALMRNKNTFKSAAYRSTSFFGLATLGMTVFALPAYAQCVPVTATSATCNDNSGTPGGLSFTSPTGFTFLGGANLEVVRPDGENFNGVQVVGTGASTLTVTLDYGASISTSGFLADGVEVHTEDNDNILIDSSANISIIATPPVTPYIGTSGLFGWNGNVASTATIIITNHLQGEIEADGEEGMGIYGLQKGNGSVTLRNDGAITTYGLGGWGVHAWISNATSTADTTITLSETGTIYTEGEIGTTLYSLNGGLGSAYVFSEGSSETLGFDADALLAYVENGASAGNAEIRITDSATITTRGDEAEGAWAITAGTGTALIINDGTILVEGSYSSGLYGLALGAGAVEIEHNASITSTGEFGLGIRGVSAGGSVHVSVADEATILGGWEAIPVSGAMGSAGVLLNSATGSTLENFGSIVAGSDRAIADEARWGAAGTGAVEILNYNSVLGYIELAANAGNSFTNFSGAKLMLRHFADTDGDGTSDIKRVSISDFGEISSTFENSAGALVALAEVPAGIAFDAAGYYVPTTGVGEIPLAGDGFYDFSRSQIVQAQFVNLGQFSNAGIIDLRGPATGNTLVMTGNAVAGGAAGTGLFISEGGQLLLNTVFGPGVVPAGGSGSQSDVLILDRTELGSGGATLITIDRREGSGAQTTSNGILLVEVRDAAQSAPDVFTLDGDFVLNGEQRVLNGAWSYGLYHNGIDADAADGNWYLRNTGTAPTVPVYVEYPDILRPLIEVPTLRERVGNRTWRVAPAAPQPAPTIFCKDPSQNYRCAVTPEQDAYYADSTASKLAIERGGLWGRIEATGTTSDTVDHSLWRLQLGLDHVLSDGDKGVLVGGINLHYGTSSASIDTASGVGDIDSSGYGLGASLTWYGYSGFYVDGQIQASSLESDFASTTLGTSLASDVKATGYAASVELGQSFRLGEHWSLTPQAQLVWTSLTSDSFTDPYGNSVEVDGADVLRGRLGLAAEYQRSWETSSGLSRASFYGIVNIHDTLSGSPTVRVAGTPFESDRDDREIGLGLGGSRNWSDDRYSIYGQIDLKTGLDGFGDTRTTSGTLGMRLRW